MESAEPKPATDQRSEPAGQSLSSPPGRRRRWRTLPLGKPKSPLEPGVFHKISLMAFLAWVGLGSDGMSSSAYGPEEAFRALGEHHYLAVGLVIATTFTIFVISYAYSRIIEHFPYGGGGYAVATKLLGPRLGVVSGSALLVDYVLTISVSIAAAADACFSFLPPGWQTWKVPVEFGVIGLFMVMNLRGVKESVTVIAPVFLLFIATHLILILGVIVFYAGAVPEVVQEVCTGFRNGMATLGLGGLVALFLHAYTRGAGTSRGLRRFQTGCRLCGSPELRRGSAPCSTWQFHSPRPPAASSCATC